MTRTCYHDAVTIMKWNKAFYQNLKSHKLFFLSNLSDYYYINHIILWSSDSQKSDQTAYAILLGS